jgi:hypothetical protein
LSWQSIEFANFQLLDYTDLVKSAELVAWILDGTHQPLEQMFSVSQNENQRPGFAASHLAAISEKPLALDLIDCTCQAPIFYHLNITIFIVCEK